MMLFLVMVFVLGLLIVEWMLGVEVLVWLIVLCFMLLCCVGLLNSVFSVCCWVLFFVGCGVLGVGGVSVKLGGMISGVWCCIVILLGWLWLNSLLLVL